MLCPGDILISMTGYIGDTAWVRESDLPAVVNQRVGIFSLAEPHAIERRFLFYVLRSDEVRSEFERRGYGSAQPNISPSLIQTVAIPLPPLAEQRAIAEVLGALDDKIEANRRVAQLTEQLARALFSDALAAFEDGKAVLSPLGNYIEHLPGKYLPRADYVRAGRYKVYGSNSVMGTHDRYLYEGPFTVMARIGSNCGALVWSAEPAWVNNNASALRARPGVDPWFLHRFLQTIDMDQHRAGSGQPFIRVDSLLATPVRLPDEDQQRLVGVKLRALADRAWCAETESTSISALRDTLLPRLLSGELRVRDAESIVGEAV
jgi:type I restriction enzyme S subunit